MKVVISSKQRVSPTQDLKRVLSSVSNVTRVFAPDEASDMESYISNMTLSGHQCHTFEYGQSFENSNSLKAFAAVA